MLYHEGRFLPAVKKEVALVTALRSRQNIACPRRITENEVIQKKLNETLYEAVRSVKSLCMRRCDSPEFWQMIHFRSTWAYDVNTRSFAQFFIEIVAARLEHRRANGKVDTQDTTIKLIDEILDTMAINMRCSPLPRMETWRNATSSHEATLVPVADSASVDSSPRTALLTTGGPGEKQGKEVSESSSLRDGSTTPLSQSKLPAQAEAKKTYQTPKA